MIKKLTTSIAIVSILFSSLTLNAKDPPKSTPTQIIEKYLQIPYPEQDSHGKYRTKRLDALRALKKHPDQAIHALKKALPTVKDPRHREELIESLRYFPTRQSADLACDMLKDSNQEVRGQAIQVLRLMARRIDCIGPQRTIRPRPVVKIDPADKEKNIRQRLANKAKGISTPKTSTPEVVFEFPPQVTGLVPHLIEAANDTHYQNRIFALYALADTCDPKAVIAMQKRLKDPHEKVRLTAACLLTEYKDKNSIPELEKTLIRLSKTKPTDQFDYYWTAARVIPALERITKKSFGQAPMVPGFLSDHRQIKKNQAQYNELIKKWAKYFQDQKKDPLKTVKTKEELLLEKVERHFRKSLASGWTPPWKKLEIPFTDEQIKKMPTKELGTRL
jgi:hypothetical protein